MIGLALNIGTMIFLALSIKELSSMYMRHKKLHDFETEMIRKLEGYRHE